MPFNTSIDSLTSNAFPTALPRGVSIWVISATVFTPALLPISTMVSANCFAREKSFMNAPRPALTSKTNDCVPSAIFLLMMEEAIKGIHSTAPMTSLKEYIFRSAGAKPAPAAVIKTPTSLSC